MKLNALPGVTRQIETDGICMLIPFLEGRVTPHYV